MIDAAVGVRRQGNTGPAGIVIETDSPVQTRWPAWSPGSRRRASASTTLRERIDGGDPAVAAVIVVVQRD